MEEYFTVLNKVETELIEKKSRFVTNVCPVEDEEQANKFIEDIKTKYWDAAHNVYVYCLNENNIQRFSDDGEPKGTAGMPVLNVLTKMNLKNTVVVVTRYFGGIKLGAGGLVRVYSKAAKEGIIEAGIVKNVCWSKVSFAAEYDALGKIKSKILELGYIISEIIYENFVWFIVLLPPDSISSFESIISDMLCRNSEVKVLGTEFITVDENNKLVTYKKN